MLDSFIKYLSVLLHIQSDIAIMTKNKNKCCSKFIFQSHKGIKYSSWIYVALKRIIKKLWQCILFMNVLYQICVSLFLKEKKIFNIELFLHFLPSRLLTDGWRKFYSLSEGSIIPKMKKKPYQSMPLPYSKTLFILS